jgi:hypothetical protein
MLKWNSYRRSNKLHRNTARLSSGRRQTHRAEPGTSRHGVTLCAVVPAVSPTRGSARHVSHQRKLSMSTQTSHQLFSSCILTVLADVRKVSDHCYITAVSRCFVMLRKQHYRVHYRPAWSNLRYSMLLNEELATLQSLGTDSRTSTSATDNGDWKILSPLCWRPSLQFRPLGPCKSPN